MKISTIIAVIVCVWVGPLNAFAQRKSPTPPSRPAAQQPATKTASASGPSRTAAAAAGTKPDDTTNASTAKPVSPEFVIGPEDVLGIWVWHEADFTRKVFVRPDGKIGLPFLRDIQASGLTTSQLADVIKQEAKKLLSDPEVSVTVEEIHSQVVNLLGAVNKPGVYPLGSPMTVVDLLARAGGLLEYAKKDEILILRSQGPFMSTRYIFNYNEFLNNRNYQQNMELKNQDTVIVRE
jgi:polysaccharide export outer membrane protein